MKEIWFGCMSFGSQVDEETAAQLVHRCLDAGITRFDTADAYNWGKSEEILGRVLAGVDGVVIATKVGAQYGKAPQESGLSKDWILRSIDGSLRRLGLDAVDVYYMHQPDYRVPIDETLGAFDQVMAQGKAKAFGISNFAAWQVMEMIAAGRKPVIAQQMWNVITRNVEQEWVPFARKYEIPTLAYNQLAGGLLTGKHDAARPPAAGTRFAGNDMYQRRFWQPALFGAVAKLRRIAERAGKTLLELSLQWAAQHADGLLLGATSLAQLEANLAALEGTLDESLLRACDEVWTELRGPVAPYNR